MQGVFVAVTVYLTLRTVLFRCRLESSFATDGLTSGPGASHRISIRDSLRRVMVFKIAFFYAKKRVGFVFLCVFLREISNLI